jgi:hypothetical protein
MTLSGILSSPSQRRTFLLATWMTLVLSIIVVMFLSHLAPSTPVWNALSNIASSIVASGIFTIFAALYIGYFFSDPGDLVAKSVLLPQDIGRALRDMASAAHEYRIYVRTGRHFRAEILPILVKKARESRCRLRIEVILLDFRSEAACDRYADYRKASSFDRDHWSREYVQSEILATILALSRASRENRRLIEIDLLLSSRLSTFRIEGSSDEILVTREDPKDVASRYLRSHNDFAAFSTELSWIAEEAYRVPKDSDGSLPATLGEMFGEGLISTSIVAIAEQSIDNLSPYVR